MFLARLFGFGPSLLAFAALVAIQVTVSLVYKSAGNSGGYKFSQSSALAMSELVKCLLSYLFLLASLSGPNGKSDRADLELPLTSEYTSLGKPRSVMERAAYTNAYIKSHFNKSLIPTVATLAAMYAMNNQLAFFLFLLVDPGTISLMKTGSTICSAIILKLFGRTVTELQWIALILQFLGIIVSQYNPSAGGSTYPLSSYSLLLLSVSITALCGCVNDQMNKSVAVSLHCINFYLYLFGFAFNLSAHIVASIASPATPSLFEGYNAIAITVVLCNSLIGIAITYVYKYADAIVKTIAQTISTAILLVLSAVFFGAQLGMMQCAGVMIVFVSTYFYFISKNYSITTSATTTATPSSTTPSYPSGSAASQKA
ncbi:hypothetical protein HDU96_002455 [Phlyctochytrium bullatum]|nr:hypothetical protein HDU96_002455 [Phlyctochytrium bullatum]